LSSLGQAEYTLISQQHDKTEKLLQLWIDKNKENGSAPISIGKLQNCLEAIDRYDVYDDLSNLLGKHEKLHHFRFWIDKHRFSRVLSHSKIYQRGNDNSYLFTIFKLVIMIFQLKTHSYSYLTSIPQALQTVINWS
jgi:hypothetical protein